MKWELASTSEQQEVYELWHNEKKLLSLDFHPFTNSARIQYANEKRVFLIRKEGFLRNRTVLRNEYGMRMGQIGYEKINGSDGTLELEGEKFLYSVRNEPNTELVIYRESPEKPFVACGIDPRGGNPSLSFKNNSLKPSQHFLLMALCWYMFLPVAKENNVEYAM